VRTVQSSVSSTVWYAVIWPDDGEVVGDF
jgi:hypothetical protein